MKRPVATNKPRITTYVEESTYQRTYQEAENSGLSVSKWVEDTLELRLSEESVIIKLDPETFKQIKKLAEEGFRPIEDQVRLLLNKALQM